jgi:Xaa-Pro aminopeptidase
MKIPPLSELKKTLINLQGSMASKGISSALIFQNADLYYFTGMIGPNCFFVPVEGAPILLSRQRGKLPTCGLGPTYRYDSWGQMRSVLKEFSYLLPGKSGLEFDVLPTAMFLKIQEKVFPDQALVDISWIIRRQRAVKSTWEIAIIRETALRDKFIWDKVPEMLVDAKTDIELGALFEAEARRLGHIGILRIRSFNMEMSITCTLSDEKGAWPSFFEAPLTGVGHTKAYPFGASGAKLKPDKPILIDFGGCYEGYITDLTRMCAIGQLPQKALVAFDLAIGIQRAIVKIAKPGITCGEIYEVAYNMAKGAGWDRNFMGAAGGVPFLGHGVGLEIDELPVLSRGSEVTLEEGMVLAIEPKFVVPGIGGIGIENCFVVKENGIDKLSPVADEIILISSKNI